MKRFLVKILVFFLLLPLIWVFFVFVYGSMVPAAYQKNLRYASAGGYTSSRFAEADTTRNVDVLVLGSSHAYRGFDPRIFASHQMRLFNLGTSSQRAVQTKYLVNKYIDRLRPKLVIFEVSSMNLTGDGLESALDICYSMARPDEDLFSMILEINKVKAYNTFIYAMLKSIGGQIMKRELRMHGDRYVPGGYVESHATVENKGILHRLLKGRRIDFKKSKQLEPFEEILAMLREKNIPVILVQAPVSESQYTTVMNHDEIDRYFSSFTGVPYYNFNKIISLDDNCFIDVHHLNQRGVEIFNNALIKRITPRLPLTLSAATGR